MVTVTVEGELGIKDDIGVEVVVDVVVDIVVLVWIISVDVLVELDVDVVVLVVVEGELGIVEGTVKKVVLVLTGDVDEAICVVTVDKELVVLRGVEGRVLIVVNIDVVVMEGADVDLVGDVLLDRGEAVTVVVGVVCVISFDEGELEVICAVEVDMAALDVVMVVVDVEGNDEVKEGVSVVLVLIGVIDGTLEAVKGDMVETVVVWKIVDVDVVSG